jgi:predicted NAD/FAD-dependent oxidoreductase
LAGLAAAEALQDAGHRVAIFEKSRGVGGRTATRRAGELRFDHGAPYLHAGAAPLSGEPALGYCALRTAAGVAVDASIGAPTANAVAKALAAGLDVRPGVHVGGIEPRPSGWALIDLDAARITECDAVLVTAPAPQTAVLLGEAAPALAARAAEVKFAACWSVMAAWEGAPLNLDWTLARDAHGIAVAISERAKPGRPAAESWVLQADPELSEAHLEDAPQEVAGLVLERFASLVGWPLPEPSHLAAHRWRYARPLAPIAERTLVEGSIAAAGDWCGGSTAGAALRSGRAAAAALHHRAATTV